MEQFFIMKFPSVRWFIKSEVIEHKIIKNRLCILISQLGDAAVSPIPQQRQLLQSQNQLFRPRQQCPILNQRTTTRMTTTTTMTTTMTAAAARTQSTPSQQQHKQRRANRWASLEAGEVDILSKPYIAFPKLASNEKTNTCIPIVHCLSQAGIR